VALSIRAPAKINLILKVTGRREDGYHNLFSIMVPVDLADTIRVARQGRGINLECKGGRVPADRRNLAWKACEAFFTHIGLEPRVHVLIDKKIPVAAGLGGGSSDAAAVLRALNMLYGQPLGKSELHRVARRLGADVPFFLLCKPCIATGIGDVLEPIENWPRFWYVITTPRFEISTAWVYGRFKLELTQGVDNYIVKLRKAPYRKIAGLLGNDLEKVVFPRYPQVSELKGQLLSLGAEGAVMSGSGPSVVGLFLSRQKAVTAAEAIIGRKVAQVFVTTLWQNMTETTKRPDDNESGVGNG